MTAALAHRGPDGDGLWEDGGAGVALGHRRLAILDLSPEGHQPMRSSSGRYTIVFNGEIYNHLELRRELEALGSRWHGHSDTETMLEAFEQWGIRRATVKLAGMFAFGVWDSSDHSLHLGRDRIGIKPLYYTWSGGRVAFASELKALRLLPEHSFEIDREACSLFFQFNVVPGSRTIYKGVKKLPPATLLTIPRGARSLPEPQEYWSAAAMAEAGISHPLEQSEEAIASDLDARLRGIVSQHMLSDVPLGGFLSGGIDSSLVVAIMQAQRRDRVRTFSLGFRQAGYDEAPFAKRVAQHLGTEHTEFYVSPRDALNLVPSLASVYDEPFADSSQIPSLLISGLARRHVTVVLTGDGGDEVFGGYVRHFLLPRLWRGMSKVPQGVRRAVAQACSRVGPRLWDRGLGLITPLLPREMRGRSGDKIHKFAQILGSSGPDAMYETLTRHWGQDENPVLGSALVSRDRGRADIDDFTHRIMFLDLVTYLPDDILTKLDRATMSVGLEARVPLLDHRLIELTWRLPLKLKIRNGRGKWILRKILSRYVPSEWFDRPKAGFGVPLDSWLRGPLRQWAEELLDEHRLKSQGILDPVLVRGRWSDFLHGRASWQYHLWDVLMFEAWFEHDRRRA